MGLPYWIIFLSNKLRETFANDFTPKQNALIKAENAENVVINDEKDGDEYRTPNQSFQDAVSMPSEFRESLPTESPSDILNQSNNEYVDAESGNETDDDDFVIIPQSCPFEGCVQQDNQHQHFVSTMNYNGFSTWNADGTILAKVFPQIVLNGKLEVDDEYVGEKNAMALSSLIPKIFTFILHTVYLFNQAISEDEFNLLVSNTVQDLELNNTSIKTSNGSLITVDKIFERLQNVAICKVDCSTGFAPLKAADIRKLGSNLLLRCPNLYSFHLYGLDPNFCLLSFKYFIMTNEKIDVKLTFKEKVTFSGQSKNSLDDFLSHLITNPPRKMPFIRIPSYEKDAKEVKYAEYHKLI